MDSARRGENRRSTKTVAGDARGSETSPWPGELGHPRNVGDARLDLSRQRRVCSSRETSPRYSEYSDSRSRCGASGYFGVLASPGVDPAGGGTARGVREDPSPESQGSTARSRSRAPDTLASMSELAGTLLQENQFSDAESVLHQILEIQKRIMGPDNPDTAISRYNLACVASRRGHKEEALSYLHDAIEHGLPPSAALRIDKDSDLTSLHRDRRFEVLVSRAKERAAAQTTHN